MKSNRRTHPKYRLLGCTAALLVMLSSGLVGCGDDADALPPGSINVSWLVGSGGCSLSDVDTIAVFLSGAEVVSTELRAYSCDDGVAVLESLEPGTYDIQLIGRDADGNDRFSGQETNILVRSDGQTTVPTIRLSALPGSIRVTWYFANGRMCAFNGVTSVETLLFEDEYEIYANSADCTAGVVELTDIQADTYIVDLAGRDTEGVILFNGQQEVTIQRGDNTDIEVRLETVDSGSLDTANPR